MIHNILKKLYDIIKKLIGSIVWILLLPFRLLGWIFKTIFLFFTSHNEFIKFVRKFLFAFSIGSLSAVLITFLTYIPKLALVESSISLTDEKKQINHILYRFENVGDSESKKVFGWFFYGERGERFSDFKQPFYSDVGDIDEGSKFVLNYTVPYGEKHNYTILILSYRDSNKLRYWINRIIGIKLNFRRR